MNTKPGYKTTEFWLTIAANVAAILAAVADVLPPDKAALVLAVSNGIYAVSRGMAKKVITLLFPLLLLAGGCATTAAKPDVDRIAPVVKTAAFVGTFYFLQEKPAAEPAFRIALNELRLLEAAESIDFNNILWIVNRLPVKELKSDEAVLIVTSATILLAELGGPSVPIERLRELRPIVVALRQGIDLALQQTPSR